jgi:hypothetical protein
MTTNGGNMSKKEKHAIPAVVLAMAAVFMDEEIRRGSNVDDMIRVMRLKTDWLRSCGASLPDDELKPDAVCELVETVMGKAIVRAVDFGAHS